MCKFSSPVQSCQSTVSSKLSWSMQSQSHLCKIPTCLSQAEIFVHSFTSFKKHWCQTSIHMLVRFVPAQHSRVFPGEKNEFKLQSVSIYEQEGVTFAPFSEAV